MYDTQRRTTFTLSHLEVALLLYHVHAAGMLPDEVGFEDADRTLLELCNQLERRNVPVSREALESALWSANLMDELGYFFHPVNVPFKDFVKKLLNRGVRADEEGHYRFDRFYNWIDVTNKKEP